MSDYLDSGCEDAEQFRAVVDSLALSPTMKPIMGSLFRSGFRKFRNPQSDLMFFSKGEKKVKVNQVIFDGVCKVCFVWGVGNPDHFTNSIVLAGDDVPVAKSCITEIIVRT